MACYHPLRAWRGNFIHPETGKRQLVFTQPKVAPGFEFAPLTLPCGQCHGCRLENSRQWAIRCVHEASLHENNCFITLTLADEFNEKGTLIKQDFQKFMKRLRKKYKSTKENPIRFYQCGEYGEKHFRPHYHAIIFNHDFKDKKLWQIKNGQNLYISAELSQLWKFGHSTIGSVTFESAAYVARYIMKKINGKLASEQTGPYNLTHYQKINEQTGEIFDLLPEYTTMSRRPGIATNWLSKYLNDVYPDDTIIINGKKLRPPKFYDNLYEHQYPSDFQKLKTERKTKLKKHAENNTTSRLQVREAVQLAKSKLLIRDL